MYWNVRESVIERKCLALIVVLDWIEMLAWGGYGGPNVKVVTFLNLV